jgi:hypothetical protein
MPMTSNGEVTPLEPLGRPSIGRRSTAGSFNFYLLNDGDSPVCSPYTEYEPSEPYDKTRTLGNTTTHVKEGFAASRAQSSAISRTSGGSRTSNYNV